MPPKNPNVSVFLDKTIVNRENTGELYCNITGNKPVEHFDISVAAGTTAHKPTYPTVCKADKERRHRMPIEEINTGNCVLVIPSNEISNGCLLSKLPANWTLLHLASAALCRPIRISPLF